MTPEPECPALPAQYLIENTHLSGNDRLTHFRTPGQIVGGMAGAGAMAGIGR
jgi:hypothetical protein